MTPVVRVSILRCAPERFAELRQMAVEADLVLRPGIEAMPGLLAYYFGADEATSSLTNVSLWISLEAAKQLDTFQPMLELGKAIRCKGCDVRAPHHELRDAVATERFGGVRRSRVVAF